jgi:hypothetical protein
VPAPLKKIQERFVPEGNIENLRIMRAALAGSYQDAPPTLAIDTVVMDGEYEGEPVTDFLNIQESKKNPGELYISRKGKLHQTLKNALSTREFNDLADKLAQVEEDRTTWIELMAEALKDAGNPVFRSVVVLNDPEDIANRRNKLTKEPDEIGPYVDPETDKEINETAKRLLGNGSSKKKTKKAEADLSPEEEKNMKEVSGS